MLMALLHVTQLTLEHMDVLLGFPDAVLHTW